MIIFYTQIENPDSKDRKRFLRIKTRIGKTFRVMKKENKTDNLVIKSGDNWLAIFQFRATT